MDIVGKVTGGVVMKKWKLKRVVQCEKCPWKVSTNPYEIPGYIEEQHRDLGCTIADQHDLAVMSGGINYVMSCHEHDNSEEVYCVGWLVNQLGQGNNLSMRVRFLGCENRFQIRAVGAQHACYEDTLPRGRGDASSS